MSESNSNKKSRTDWDRLRSLSDEDIDTSDIPPLTKEFFENAELRVPEELVEVPVLLDARLYAWLRAQGEDWQRRLNAALRLYVEAHRAYPERKEKRESA